MTAALSAIFIAGAALLVFLGITSASQRTDAYKAAEALEYLSRLKSVAWHQVDDNNVYIGFDSPTPEDWKAIARGAAISGNQATGRVFHAWAVHGQLKGWRPGDAVSVLGKLTAWDMEIVRGYDAEDFRKPGRTSREPDHH